MASVLDRMSGTLVGGQLPTSSWEQSAMGGVLRFQLGRPTTPSTSDGCDAGRWGESAHQLQFRAAQRRKRSSRPEGKKALSSGGAILLFPAISPAHPIQQCPTIPPT